MKTEMYDTIYNSLIGMAEPEYQRFASRLLPGVENILGVRLPKLRKFAKKIGKMYGTRYLDEMLRISSDEMLHISSDEVLCESSCGDFAESMEDVLLQGMVIGNLSADISISRIQDYIRRYVPKINNWSTCDSFCAGLKIAREYPEEMWEFLQGYLASERDYDVRFGIVMIINYYIQDDYLEEIFEIFSMVGKNWCRLYHVPESTKEKDRQGIQGIYYVEMALAWAISICYVRYPERTMVYLEEMRAEDDILDDFTYHKALQKIVESHCVETGKKAEIKLMKRIK